MVTIFASAERFMGFLYRVYLSRALGPVGLGIYQITLSVVGVLVTLCASGIPITVSRLMLKERAKSDRVGEADVISAGILTSILVSAPIVVVLLLFREKLTFIFADERCYDVLVIILPGIVLTGVYAVIRGYFWGNRYYLSYSLIEFIEEAVMVAIGMILVSRATDLFDGAKKAGVAVFISYIVSFCLSSLVFAVRSGKLTNPIRKLKPLVVSSSPITVTRTLSSLMGSFVALILPARLVFYGMTKTQSISAFGEMSGMAMPLLFMPSTFIGSIALVLVPEISDDYYNGRTDELNKNIIKAFDCCVIISALVAPVFLGAGKEIGAFIYSSESAGVYLAVASFTMFPMSVSMMTTSLLNSVNKERFTLVNYLIGALFTLLSIIFLPKHMGIYSLIAGYAAGYIVMSVSNVLMLKRFCKGEFRWLKTLSLSAAASAAAGVFCYLLTDVFRRFAPLLITLVLSSVSTVAFTFILLCVFDVLSAKKLFAFVGKNRKKEKIPDKLPRKA